MNICFVITGPPSSGKSTITKLIGEFASSKNIPFDSLKFSSPIALGLEKMGYKVVSENGGNYYVRNGEKISQRTLMQNYGNELREKEGPEALAKLLLKEDVVHKIKKGAFVFEGCRNIHEYEFIREKCIEIGVKCKLVGIYADLQTCFKRASSNKPASFEDFKKQYELEMRDYVDDDEIQVRNLLEISKNIGIYIENNRDFESFKETIIIELEKLHK